MSMSMSMYVKRTLSSLALCTQRHSIPKQLRRACVWITWRARVTAAPCPCRPTVPRHGSPHPRPAAHAGAAATSAAVRRCRPMWESKAAGNMAGQPEHICANWPRLKAALSLAWRWRMEAGEWADASGRRFCT
eukprot:scaffold61722_cov57-Phaeocystis_antarctica.AAC.1